MFHLPEDRGVVHAVIVVDGPAPTRKADVKSEA
jgi:hypothetical protein